MKPSLRRLKRSSDFSSLKSEILKSEIESRGQLKVNLEPVKVQKNVPSASDQSSSDTAKLKSDPASGKRLMKVLLKKGLFLKVLYNLLRTSLHSSVAIVIESSAQCLTKWLMKL